MTAITDLTTVLETILKRPMLPEQLQRIGVRFFENDPYGLGVYVDPENPTNEEMAQCTLDNIARFGQDVVKRASTLTEKQDASVTVAQNVADAVSDISP